MSHTHDKTYPCSHSGCDYGPFKRNHYFTGKLMLERDFTDEQRYVIEKFLHHHQRLHGWGVVCGLKVIPHVTPECRDRFISIEPGSAVDCCGHEILLKEPLKNIDIIGSDAVAALVEKGDTDSHTLHIRIRHRECPVEEIPVLYDECGCDDSRYAPNRILETCEVEVVVDPPETAEISYNPDTAWADTVTIAHSYRVALNAATGRLYIMKADDPGSIISVNINNHAVISSCTLPGPGKAMTLSGDGTRLYTISGLDGDVKTLSVYTVSGAGGIDPTPLHEISVEESETGEISLKALPDNRLLVFLGNAGVIRIWGADINENGDPPADPVIIDPGRAGLTCPALGSAGDTLSTVGPLDKAITQVHIPGGTVSEIAVLPADAKPSSIAAVLTTGPDGLAVGDAENKRLYLVNEGAAGYSLSGSVNLTYAPAVVAVSPCGHWAYVLEKESEDPASECYLETINLQLMRQGETVFPGSISLVGRGSGEIVVSESGQYLYIPYTGDMEVSSDGGVAVIQVTEKTCCSLFERSLDGCPDCDEEDDIVLAVIENYRAGYRLEEKVDPPSDPLVDDAEKIARIDNLKQRRILPSITTIAEMLECLCVSGTGGGSGVEGPQGPPGSTGPQGPAGDGISSITVETSEPGSQATADYDPDTGTLVLVIPEGDQGDPGNGVNSATAGTVSYEAPADADYDPGTGNIHFSIPGGPPGEDGTSVSSASAESVPYGNIASAVFDPDTGNIHFRIPMGRNGQNGTDGTPGAPGPGLEKELTQIRLLSWTHAASNNQLAIIKMLDGKNRPGLVIQFTRDVNVNVGPSPIDADHIFQVLAETDRSSRELGFICRCPIIGKVVPVEVLSVEGQIITKAKQIEDPKCDSIAFIFSENTQIGKQIGSGNVPELWIKLRGDFVIDVDGRAVDAEFVRASLPTGDRPGGSTFGVQGGLFESWCGFTDKVDINKDSAKTIAEKLPGVGMVIAQRIVMRREEQPFTTVDELKAVDGINNAILLRIRDLVEIKK